jgi:hypothetical protein
MNKLNAFVRLDFMTLKPYLTVKNLLIFAVIAVFLSAVNGTVEMSLGIGFMLGALFISYPFAIGDKSNMDALYTTLSINRKTVVFGRYLFVLLLNFCCIVFSFIFTTFGVLGSKIAGIFQGEGGDASLPIILALSGVLVLVQAIQLPIFFKLGYTKAKFMSIVPVSMFMAGYAAFMSMAKESGVLAELSDSLANVLSHGDLTAVITVLALAFVVYVSYCLSLSAYKKREF